MAASRSQLGKRSFLQRLLGGQLAALVGNHLQYVGFLPQAREGSCREIPLRPQQFEPNRVACQFLLEPCQFRRTRIEPQLRGQLARIGQQR